jgi:hypothetical protein
MSMIPVRVGRMDGEVKLKTEEEDVEVELD